MITNLKLVKDRWKEHFEKLYNPTSTADRTILDELEVSDQHHVEVTVPLLRSEVENATKKMKMGRAPVNDNITAEEIVATDEAGLSIYFKLFE